MIPRVIRILIKAFKVNLKNVPRPLPLGNEKLQVKGFFFRSLRFLKKLNMRGKILQNQILYYFTMIRRIKFEAKMLSFSIPALSLTYFLWCELGKLQSSIVAKMFLIKI